MPPSLRRKPELTTKKVGGRTTSSVDRGKVIDTKKASYARVTSSLILENQVSHRAESKPMSLAKWRLSQILLTHSVRTYLVTNTTEHG